jgi:hypothetical protein
VGAIVMLVSEHEFTSKRISSQQTALLTAMTIAPLVGVLCVLVAWLAGRRDARSIRALLAATRDDANRAQTPVWTVITGTVQDSSPARAIDGQRVAMMREIDDEKLEQKFDGTFSVVDAEGEETRVDPAAATWCSVIRTRGALRDKKGETKRIVEQEIVPVGAAVLVAGRRDGTSRAMHAKGADSLLVFAAPAGTDPRAALRRLGRTRVDTIVLAGLVAASAAALDVAIATRTRIAVLNPSPLPHVVTYARRDLNGAAFEDVCSLPEHQSLARSVDDATVPLYGVPPFPITLYDARFAPPFAISSNGWMSLVRTTDSGLSGRLGSRTRPNAVIAPYWTDLRTRAMGVCVAVTGVMPHRRFVVQWQDAFDCCQESPSMHFTFEVVIHEAAAREGNVIDFVYAQMDGAHRTATIGLEDADGLESTSMSGPINAPRAIRWTPR